MPPPTWSYDAADPGGTALDRIRTTIRDVDQRDYSPWDEQITAWLADAGGDELRAALEAAKFRRDRYEQLVPQSRTAIGISTSRKNLALSPLDKIVADIEAQVVATGGGIGVFGLTYSDKCEVEDDSDFRLPFGRTGADRNR